MNFSEEFPNSLLLDQYIRTVLLTILSRGPSIWYANKNRIKMQFFSPWKLIEELVQFSSLSDNLDCVYGKGKGENDTQDKSMMVFFSDKYKLWCFYSWNQLQFYCMNFNKSDLWDHNFLGSMKKNLPISEAAKKPACWIVNIFPSLLYIIFLPTLY